MNPLVLYNTEILESEMLTFTLEGQMGATVYDGNVVKIIFEPGTDVSNLPAEFTLTDGARMYLADSIQYSALTTNDFTQDVEFTVVNPDNTPAQSFRVQIIFAEYAEIEVSSVLSPNGDKINDNWKINEVEKYRESEFTVFDAHGRIVYESIGYDNSWDGYYNGELLPVGSYFYTIKTPDGKFVKGVLSLVY